jgi:hypothetical protein
MRLSSEIRKVPVRAAASRASRPLAPPPAGRLGRTRRKLRGQSMLLIALCMLLLVALVALAVDGGAMLGERREAQNAVDGATLAGTRFMLPHYVQMVQDNENYDVDGSGGLEDAIRTRIENYAATNGVMTSTLQAYFINDNKQLVTVNVGEERGNGRCGVGQSAGPCQVGANGVVPWSLGAKGIMVKGTAKTDSFFMSIFGWDQVGANATATAFMGVGAAVDNISVVPMGLFSSTFPDLSDLEPGDHYTLLDADVGFGSGNWGWVNYNEEASGSAQLAEGWLVCGFNPSWTIEQWMANCPRYDNVNGSGPTKHYENVSPSDIRPRTTETFIGSLVYGDGYYGWWLQGSSGAVNSSCMEFERRIRDEDDGNGVVVLFPIFDIQRGGGGTDTYYHVRLIVAFRIYEDDVSCRPSLPPTPTPCPVGWTCATPTPGGGNRTRWHVEGDVDRIYSTASRGRHGSLRHTTVHVVFLDN